MRLLVEVLVCSTSMERLHPCVGLDGPPQVGSVPWLVRRHVVIERLVDAAGTRLMGPITGPHFGVP